jgi:hypothetical protein
LKSNGPVYCSMFCKPAPSTPTSTAAVIFSAKGRAAP